MPKQHGGTPYVYGDALGSVFGAAPGAAAPSDVILSTAAPADATMDVHALGFNEDTEDRVYSNVQIDHDLLIPGTGNIIFYPHVHWTFYVEPADGQTVIFKLAYVYAKPSVTLASAGFFDAAPTILTSGTYTTTASTELRAHLISTFTPAVSIPVASCGPSMIFQYTLKLDTSSTIANGRVAVLYLDWHYQKGPLGTDTEYA
jgi:hypothetical protein